jgi:hypothetical protein
MSYEIHQKIARFQVSFLQGHHSFDFSLFGLDQVVRKEHAGFRNEVGDNFLSKNT